MMLIRILVYHQFITTIVFTPKLKHVIRLFSQTWVKIVFIITAAYYGSLEGPHSDFVFIFYFSLYVFNFLIFTSLICFSVFFCYFFVFVLNVLIFTLSFCFWVEISVFILYFSVFVFNTSIFTSSFCLSVEIWVFILLLFHFCF